MPCFPSLAVRRKNSSALQGRWLEEPEGFPSCHSARETKRPLWPPQGEQKGRYDPARKTKLPLCPRGVRPPQLLRGSSPCEAGQFIPAGFDCRHSEVCKSRNSVSLNSPQFVFPDGVKSPKMQAVPLIANRIIKKKSHTHVWLSTFSSFPIDYSATGAAALSATALSATALSATTESTSTSTTSSTATLSAAVSA